MPAPEFTLALTGTAPKVTTAEALKTGVDAVSQALFDQIGAIATGLTPAGNWDASAGTFPSGASLGTYYVVNVAGTVGGQAFAIGDWLIPLRSSPSTTVYALNWFRADYSKIVPAGLPRKSYTSVAGMVADGTVGYSGTALVVSAGDILEAQGFRYEVAASGATDHHLTTAGGVKLRAIPIWAGAKGGIYSIAALGAVDDDVADNRAIIQTLIDAASAAGGGTVYLPIPTLAWKIVGTLDLPVDVHLEGASPSETLVRFRPGTYQSNFGIRANTTDGTDWIVAYPNEKTPSITNIKFETDVTSLYAIGFNGSLVVKNCQFNFFAKSIVGGTRYNDLVTIHDCIFRNYLAPATYQIDLGNSGDSVTIERCHFPNPGDNPETPLNSIRADGIALAIRDCLCGNVWLSNCTAMSTLVNVGMDGGRFLFTRCNVTMDTCALSSLESLPVITFENDTEFGYSASLRNVMVSSDVRLRRYLPHEFDMQIDNGFIISLENVYKRTIQSASPEAKHLQGIKIKSSTGTPFAAFNNYSYMYSTRSVIRNLSMAGNPFMLETPAAALTLMTPAFAYSNSTWDGTTGTYYYKAVMYWDTGRAVARTDAAAELTQAATNGGSGIGLEVTEGGYPPNRIIRVYRGTSSGSYDQYADVHVTSAATLIDTGSQVSGVPWIARTAGPVTAYNNYTVGGFGVSGGKAVFIAGAAPVEGTWQQGDTVLHRTPAAAGHMGWVCVAAGSPGTWKTYGTIAA